MLSKGYVENKTANKNPGLVVMGGYSYPEGCGFES